MKIVKIANLTDEEINILKSAGSLGRDIVASIQQGSVDKLDENSIDLVKAVIEMLNEVLTKSK